MTRPVLFSFHAVDNLAEEGVVADAAVCVELQCRPVGIVTAVLSTGAEGVEALEPLSLSLIAQQFEASSRNCRPAVLRTGILRGARQVELIAGLARDAGTDLVVAPVLRVGATSILDDETLDATRRRLFPEARVVVVRAADAPALAGTACEDVEDMKRAASALRDGGARAVLIVGVLSQGRVLDLLDDGGRIGLFDASRVAAPRIPGVAGAHAAALACHLARGRSLNRAVDAAQRYVALRIKRGR